MKNLLLILALFVGNIFVETLKTKIPEPPTEKATLFCQIEDQSILRIKDGISTKYSSFTDQAKNGNKISIIFHYTTRRFLLESPEYEPIRISSRVWKPSLDSEEYREIKRRSFPNTNSYGVIAYLAEIDLNEDEFNIRDKVLDRFIVFERYYKNDWQMTFNDVYSGITVVANCINQNGFQRMLNYYDKYTEKR